MSIETEVDVTTIAQEAAPSTSPAVFNPISQALAELRQRYAGLAFNMQTVKGNEEARQARSALVTLRNDADRAYTAWNAPILEQQKLARQMRDSIKAEVLALEEPIDEQIKADEARRAEERLKREEAEKARVSGIRARIAAIFAAPADVAGKPSADIDAAIVEVERAVAVLSDYQEFADEAAAAVETVRARLGGMLQSAKAAEAEAERVRQEAERIAAERARLAAEAAELDRQRREHEARLAAEREAREAEERRHAEERAAAEHARQQEAAAEQARIREQQAAEHARIQQQEAEAKAALAAEKEGLAKRQREIENREREVAEEARRQEQAAAAEAQRQLDAFEEERAAAAASAKSEKAQTNGAQARGDSSRIGSVGWAIEKISDLPANDAEGAHLEADEILLQVLRSNGFEEVADAYDKARNGIAFYYS